MNVQRIKEEDLRKMKDSEGLVLQGCGGDPQEWVDGINTMLTKTGILLDGTVFSQIYSFEHQGTECLLFPFGNDVHLNVGKLAMWRLSTHNTFGGTWLSDYVENHLGGFVTERVKPDCALIGEDGNIFHLARKAAHTLKQNGMEAESKEMLSRVMASGSYEEALGVIGDYVNITDGSESEDFDEGQGMTL